MKPIRITLSWQLLICFGSLLLGALFSQLPAASTYKAAGSFVVRDFGARGDGVALDTKALQAAIDACHDAGGGTVLFPAGRYLTGTLYLKSNVGLRLDLGATLLGSPNLADYGTDTFRTMYKNEAHMDRCLIFAQGAENITLEGGGTIDGQGARFPEPGDTKKNRPMLLRFVNCQRLQLRGLTLQNPASWTTAWLYCRDIVVDAVTIRSRANINGDGLDFDGCEQVRVSNSTFDNSDDCICLQTSRPDRPCRDVTVTNCTFTSRWAGLRIGLLSRGDFENITVSNCTFRDIRDSGLKIQMGEGATMSNMTFTNLVMHDVLKPVFMTLSQHRAAVDAPAEFAPVGKMSGFLFSHILVRTTTGGKDAAFIITGLPGHPIEDVRFTDIRATFAGGGTAEHASNPLAELTPENLAGRWPEYSRFNGTVPAHGFFARHVRGLALQNVAFATSSPDARPPVVLDDVTQLAETLSSSATPPALDRKK